jgi:hypothetical protein
MDQFSQWREAITNGKPVEYTKGSPTAGYFKRPALQSAIIIERK